MDFQLIRQVELEQLYNIVQITYYMIPKIPLHNLLYKLKCISFFYFLGPVTPQTRLLSTKIFIVS